MARTIRDSQNNPRAALLATAQAIGAARSAAIGNERTLYPYMRFPLSSGDLASESSQLIAESELDAELLSKINTLTTAAAQPYVFVYSPGYTGAQANIFSSFTDLYAALSSVQGPRILMFDDSNNGGVPLVIPAGVYDFANVIWLGDSTGLPNLFTVVEITAGSVFTNFCEATRFVAVRWLGNTSLVTLNDGLFHTCFLDYASRFQCLGTGAFFEVASSGTFLLLGLIFGGAIDTSTVEPINLSAAGAFLQIFCSSNGAISDNSVAGVAGSSVAVQVDSTGQLSTNQPNFIPGWPSYSLISNSNLVAYDDSLTAPVLGVTQVQAAIDVLKVASTYTLEQEFDFLSPAFIDFGTIAADDTVISSEVCVETNFDDPSTIITLGLTSSPGGILSSNDVDASIAATYSSLEVLKVVSLDSMRLQVLPATSTQGSGRVIVTVRRNT